MERTNGVVVRVAGVVIDVYFQSGNLPGIKNALVIELDESTEEAVDG